MLAKNEANQTIFENSFTVRFIDTLMQDIRSSEHASQVNNQVLAPAIHLLKNRDLCPQLTVEQIVRGAMNMALTIENSKYSILKREIIGEELYNKYRAFSQQWFGNYNETLTDKSMPEWQRALPVIERASQGPFCMMSGCLAKTLPLYFEYAKALDPNFVIPELPITTGHNPVKFKIVTQEVNKSALKKDTAAPTEQKVAKEAKVTPANQDEESALERILKQFTDKIALEKTNKTQSERTITILEELAPNLYHKVQLYKFNKKSPEVSDMAGNYFITDITFLINKAQKDLSKELSWSDYLTNLLKSIVNVVIKGVNAITGSNFTLFKPVVPPMSHEVDELGVKLKNEVASDISSTVKH